MEFNRGADIKAILELGGINIQNKFDETVGEWRKYYSSFIGKTVKFTVNRRSYNNWEDRIENGNLTEIKTMKVKEASDSYTGQSGQLYFMEEGSGQCWFVDMSEPLYILK